MARKTAAKLDAEIAAALREGRTPPPAPVAAWKRLIKDIQSRARHTSGAEARAALQHELDAAYDGMRAAQKTSASSPTFVTGTNLFALAQQVIAAGGPSFSNRVSATDRPHLKRALDAGLIESGGGTLRLTPAGREAVADYLVSEISRESKYTPRENTLMPPETRARVLEKDIAEHKAKLDKLERALAAIR